MKTLLLWLAGVAGLVIIMRTLVNILVAVLVPQAPRSLTLTWDEIERLRSTAMHGKQPVTIDAARFA